MHEVQHGQVTQSIVISVVMDFMSGTESDKKPAEGGIDECPIVLH